MVKDLCFEILDKCPNKCMFCSSNSCIDKNTFISFDAFKRTIDYFIVNGGIEELSLSGGEPLMHPDLLEMINYASNYGINVTLFTSGIKYASTISDEEKNYYLNALEKSLSKVNPDDTLTIKGIKNYYENILKNKIYGCISKSDIDSLVNAGLKKIVFDVQAYEYETDETLMGRKNSMKVLLLDSLYNASRSSLFVDIHFIPNKLNYKEIPDLLELIDIIDVDRISFLNFVPQGRGKENKETLKLTDAEKEEFFSLLERSRNLFKGEIRLGIPLNDNQTHKCNAGISKLDIKYDGNILPCPAFKELSKEDYEKYGIKLYNIYDSLENIKINGNGYRAYPLCKKVYANHE